MAILGPHLASTIVIALSGHVIDDLNVRCSKKIDEHNDFKLLDLLHHYSSGVKAFVAEYSYIANDEMR
jgi:hypothetical protein